MTEYYGDGTLPASGTIKMSDFYGQASATTEVPSNASSAIVSLTGTTGTNNSINASIGANGLHNYNEGNKSSRSHFLAQGKGSNGHSYRDFCYMFFQSGTNYSGLPHTYEPNGSNYFGTRDFPKWGLNSSYYTVGSGTKLTSFGQMKTSTSYHPSPISVSTGYYWVGFFVNQARSNGNAYLQGSPTFNITSGSTTVNFTMTTVTNGTSSATISGSTIISMASSGTFDVVSMDASNRHGGMFAIPVSAV
jgi:hypothetical protein